MVGAALGAWTNTEVDGPAAAADERPAHVEMATPFEVGRFLWRRPCRLCVPKRPDGTTGGALYGHDDSSLLRWRRSRAISVCNSANRCSPSGRGLPSGRHRRRGMSVHPELARPTTEAPNWEDARARRTSR